MQGVFAVRAIHLLNRDGGCTLHPLIPLCGIDFSGFEVFPEHRFASGKRGGRAAANHKSDFYFSQIHTH
jgi:hypothetical protein